MYCLGILQLALFITVTATPISRSNHRNVSLESFTALPTLPDLPQGNDLVTAAVYYEFPLPDIPVFMAAIRAMRELSKRDFEIDNIPETSWSHPLFPGAKLTVRPAPGKRLLSVRFAMWMILYSTRCMIIEKKYSGEFLSLYKRNMIGYVVTLPTAAIASQGKLSTQRAQHNDTTSFPRSNSSSAQGLGIGTATNDDDLQATVDYVGKNIDRADFFLTLFWLIVDLAPHTGDPLIVWQVTRNAINSRITTIWNRAKPPSQSPQYSLTKGDLISMLAYLPEVCLRDRKLQEMNIEIRESGEVIARGLVRMKPLLGLPSGPLIMNGTMT